MKKGCNFAAGSQQSYVLLRFLGSRKPAKLRVITFLGQPKASKVTCYCVSWAAESLQSYVLLRFLGIRKPALKQYKTIQLS